MKMMQWTHDELKSFPTEYILNSGQLSGQEVLTRSGRLFLSVSIESYNVKVDSGYWSSGELVNPIPNWATANIFDGKHHGWKRVITRKDYDPMQQPYEDTDI